MQKSANNVSYILFIAVVALLSYGRIYFFQDVTWDDNCWLLSRYASSNLKQFLDTGFFELRRVPLGMYLYLLFSIHKYTNHPYLIWHSLNVVVQVLTPIVFYLFINNLFGKNKILAFFISLCFLIVPLDSTLPYLTVSAYRIATLLTVTSFYMIERFIAIKKSWWLFIAALLITGVAEYVFMEVTVAFEMGRFFVIGYSFYKNETKENALIKKTLTYWMPFLLLAMPLVFYKLQYKPYGIYESYYLIDCRSCSNCFGCVNLRNKRKTKTAFVPCTRMLAPWNPEGVIPKRRKIKKYAKRVSGR